MGRARAWLRLALMQKRLADYLRILLEHREDTLEEYFEPHALMLNEEAVIITGLLVGLNVVDCNLCVKVSAEGFRLLYLPVTLNLFNGFPLKLILISPDNHYLLYRPVTAQCWT